MSHRLEKYSPPIEVPPSGGYIPVGGTNGEGTYQQQYLSGFYPRDEYISAVFDPSIPPTGGWLSPDYRLDFNLLTQDPPISESQKSLLIQLHNSNAGYSTFIPWVYVACWFNAWVPSTSSPPMEPLVPGYTVQTMTSGWNASARTIAEFFNQLKFAFRPQLAVPIVCGLTDDAEADQNDPNAVLFGWKFLPGVLSGGRAGGQVFEGGLLPEGGTQHAGYEFAVRRRRTGVDYLVDNIVVYTHPLPSSEPARMFHGVATIYDPLTYVDPVYISALSGADIALAPLGAFGGKAFTQVAASLKALTMTGGNFKGARISLPKLTLLGGREYGTAALKLPKLRMSSFPGTSVLGAQLKLRSLRGVGVGKTGGMGHAALTLPKLNFRSSNHSGAEVSLPPVRLTAFTDPAGEAFMSMIGFYDSTMEATRLILVSVDAAGQVVSMSTASIVRDASVDGAATISTSLAANMVLGAIMNSELAGASFEPLFEQGGETWVLNADSDANSSYENYDFNSFATFDGQLYGVRSDGLYLLEGDTDAGQPIDAAVSFGAHDFNTMKLKRLEQVFIELTSGKPVYLKVTANGQAYTYQTGRAEDGAITTQRVVVGRGLRATVMTFEIFNKKGDDFEVEGVRFEATELTRSI